MPEPDRDAAETISVAMCTYNGAPYIEAQLESLLGQTRRPDEIVVCDDGSTDATRAILARYAARFPHLFRIRHNPTNLGFSQNFMQAIELCTGDLIALCDQDDIWLENKLETLAHALALHPACLLVFSDARIVDENLHPRGYTLYSAYRAPNPETQATIQSILQGVGFMGCTMLLRAEARAYILPLTSPLWGHDHWLANILAALSPIHYIPAPLILHRRHTTNASTAQKFSEPAPTKPPPPTGSLYRRLLAKYRRRMDREAQSFVKRNDKYKRWRDILEKLHRIAPNVTDPHQQQALAYNTAIIEQEVARMQVRLELAAHTRPTRAFRLLSSGALRRFRQAEGLTVMDFLFELLRHPQKPDWMQTSQ